MDNVRGGFILPHPPLIIPEVGRGEEKMISKTVEAYRQAAAEIRALQPETIVFISPHAPAYADYIHISPGREARGDFRAFGAKDVAFQAFYDTEFVKRMVQAAEEKKLPAGVLGERQKELDHGVLIPLFFLGEYGKQCQIVRIGISFLSPPTHYALGRLISDTAKELNRKIIVIASGDLSHKLKKDGPYGFAPEGPFFDRQVTEMMARGELDRLLELEEDFCEAAGECGWRPFLVLAGALQGKKIHGELLSYEGPFGVGYAVARFMAEEKEGQDLDG